MSTEHPALVAAHTSWNCVQRRDREGWLAQIADDIVIEDPIGVAPTNPTGEGLKGIEGAQKFWDTNVAATESISIETQESFVAGNESAHVLTLTTRFPNGTTVKVHGVFVYVVNDAGQLCGMRGYWSMADALVTQPG